MKFLLVPHPQLSLSAVFLGWSELKVTKKNNDLIAVIGGYTNTVCF